MSAKRRGGAPSSNRQKQAQRTGGTGGTGGTSKPTAGTSGSSGITRPTGSATSPTSSSSTTMAALATSTKADSKAQLQAAQEAKREARLQRQAEAREAAERKKRAHGLRRNGLIAVVAIVVMGGIAASIINELSKPGQGVPQEPSAHIQSANDPHSYSTDPPTSGPHLSTLASWGVSETPVPKESSVHNLEDGGVIIDYRPDLDKSTVSRLEEIARSYSDKIIMAPYPGLSDPIVLTAWTRIDRMSALDEARIRRFIDAYRGKDHHQSSGS